jgi:hypothetical protein
MFALKNVCYRECYGVRVWFSLCLEAQTPASQQWAKLLSLRGGIVRPLNGSTGVPARSLEFNETRVNDDRKSRS